MASSGELIKVVAATLGLPEASVLVAFRNLRIAGLVSKSGRGNSAAKMTPKDAALLLLSVVGTTVIKDSLIPISRHAKMRPWGGIWNLHFFPVPELQSLDADHTFLDAVEALVIAAQSGSLANCYGIEFAEFLNLATYSNPPTTIQISMQEPFVWSSIRIAMIDGDGAPIAEEMETQEYGRATYMREGVSYRSVPLNLGVGADLRHVHTITQKTLAAIARLLAK